MIARRCAVAAVVLLLLAGLASSARAQSDGQIILRPRGSQYGFPDETNPDRRVWAFLGGVEVIQGDRRMLGDTLILVLDKDGEQPAAASASGSDQLVAESLIAELFLDGNVSMEEGDEQVVGAASLHIDRDSGLVTILDGAWHSTARGGPLIIRYEVMRLLADGRRELEDLSYTTCEYAHAHWSVHTPWARIVPTGEGRELHTAPNAVSLGGLPVLWLPALHFNIDRDRPPLRSVGVRSTNRYGTEVETTWGGDASGLLRALGADGPVRAEWELAITNSTARGVLYEPEWTYRTEASTGRVRGAYIRDSKSQDFLDDPIEDKTRGRFDVEHRTRLDDHRTLDVELSYLSDRGFLEEYYENEAKTDKEQESYVSYRDVEENTALSVLARGKLNDFQSSDDFAARHGTPGQVEYAPEIVYRRTGELVGRLGDASLTGRVFVSHAKADPEIGPSLPPTDPPFTRRSNLRVGTTAALTWPFDVGDDRLRATAGVDVTAFEHSTDVVGLAPAVGPATLRHDDGAVVRHALTGGVEWSRTYSGDTEYESDTWNLDGVRQIVEPRAGYASVFELSKNPDELVLIDEVETLGKGQAFFVGLRHRIQTRRSGRVETILQTDVSMPIYPNEDRDNAGERNGPILVDALWTPGADVWGLRNGSVRWRALIDPATGTRTKSFLAYRTNVGPDQRFEISNDKANSSAPTAPGVSSRPFNFLTLGMEWVLTPKWTMAVYAQEDLLLEESVRTGMVLRQTAHRWLIDVELSRRRGASRTTGVNQGRGLDDTRVSVSFTPTIAQREGETLLDSLGRIR